MALTKEHIIDSVHNQFGMAKTRSDQVIEFLLESLERHWKTVKMV
jgi:nucleoid DNA-binding protein